jgi:hypothetical protein
MRFDASYRLRRDYKSQRDDEGGAARRGEAVVDDEELFVPVWFTHNSPKLILRQKFLALLMLHWVIFGI